MSLNIGCGRLLQHHLLVIESVFTCKAFCWVLGGEVRHVLCPQGLTSTQKTHNCEVIDANLL